MRIVTDTNLVVSAFVWGGNPEIILMAAREARVTLYTSPALIAELEDILSRKKSAKALSRVGSTPAQLVSDYLALAQLVRPVAVPRVVPNDIDDDQVIAAAVTANADLIVSGDGDLIGMKQYQGIPILTAARAVERINNIKQ